MAMLPANDSKAHTEEPPKHIQEAQDDILI